MPVTVGCGKSVNAYVYSVFGSSIQNLTFTGVDAVTELKLILKELLSAVPVSMLRAGSMPEA